MNLRNRLDRAEKQAPSPSLPYRVVLTEQIHPCQLHTERGPETYKAEDGTKHPVTDAMRDQWEREGVLVIQQVYVGTCHTNGCDPSLPGAERWP
jgi:hypothetical protein